MLNPLRSEADAFRLLWYVVAVFAAIVIVVLRHPGALVGGPPPADPSRRRAVPIAGRRSVPPGRARDTIGGALCP